jgi:hypothetical protein
MNATARRPTSGSAPASGWEPSDDDASLADDFVPRSKRDLIAESKRIRDECNDLVRRYQRAVGVRVAPPTREPMPPRRATLDDAASRRKALLLLLIEELV